MFGGVVLINGILAILLIEFFQAVGWREVQPAEGSEAAAALYELEPIDDVAVLAERHLVDLLEGATLREAGPPWHRHPAISPARPEDWIDFLCRHPARRQ